MKGDLNLKQTYSNQASPLFPAPKKITKHIRGHKVFYPDRLRMHSGMEVAKEHIQTVPLLRHDAWSVDVICGLKDASHHRNMRKIQTTDKRWSCGDSMEISSP